MAQRIPINSLMTAIYSALTSDVTLTALVPAARIVDYVDDNIDYPWVRIGPYEQQGNETKGTASAPIVDIEARSESAGMKEVNQIIDAITEILTDSTLSLGDGFSTHTGLLIGAEGDAERDPGGRVIRWASVRFQWTVVG